MKKSFATLLTILLMTLFSFGQTLDGYKYVYVQTLTYDGENDIWNISGMVRSFFSKKGFIVLSESSNPPLELKSDPCLLLTCEVNHTNVSAGVNKVTIILKNCKEETVHSNTAGAMGLSLQSDYNKATKRAFSEINDMSYSFNPSKTVAKEIEKNLPTLELTGLTEDSIKAYLANNKIDPLEGLYKSYQTEGMPYYKIGIVKREGKFKAVVIESELLYWKPGELKAIFEQSSIKGLYSVKWYMGNKTPYETFGNMDNSSVLSIELKDPKSGEKK